MKSFSKDVTVKGILATKLLFDVTSSFFLDFFFITLLCTLKAV